MAHYFWIGQTPTSNAGLNPFYWNVASNWRTASNLNDGTPADITQPIKVNSVSPTNPPNGKDIVWIGHPVFTTASDGTRTYIQAKTPLLFGGLSGGITLNSSHGITWALSNTSLGNTFSLQQVIIGGVPFTDTDDPADPITFTGAYPFEMIGGGISGGESYWPTIDDFKTWAKARYPALAAATDWPTANQVSGTRHKDSLKIKTNSVLEILHTPLNVYLKIAKSPEFGTGLTLPRCNYFRYGTKVNTSLYDSTLSRIDNRASFKASDYTRPQVPNLLDPENNLFLKRCAFDVYVGHYDDSVQISHDCVWNKTQITSNTPTTGDYVKNRWFVTIGGKAGITYTAPYLGLKRSTLDIPYDLQLVDGKRKPESSPPTPVLYDDDHKVKLGHQGGLNGVTSYIGSISSQNANISFDGNIIIESFDQQNCYIVSDHKQPISDKDSTNIFYYNMNSASKLDLAKNPNYNGWKFGNIFIDSETGALGITVEGGIYSKDGSNNQIFGSPGVNLFNDILIVGNVTKRLPVNNLVNKKTIDDTLELGL